MSDIATYQERDYGQILKKIRLERGLTQWDFADLAGRGRMWVWELENGRHKIPQVDAICMLADNLGISADVLLGREP